MWAVLLLIASALLAAAAKHYDDTITISIPFGGKVEYNACKQLKDSKADSQCGQLIGAAVLYLFICNFVFLSSLGATLLLYVLKL